MLLFLAKISGQGRVTKGNYIFLDVTAGSNQTGIARGPKLAGWAQDREARHEVPHRTHYLWGTEPAPNLHSAQGHVQSTDDR